MATTLYKGFSTYNRRKKFKLTDFELAKQDLFNHLNTRRGENLADLDFGTIIWDTIFEPMTPEVKTAIQDDLQKVVNYDPRLSCESMSIAEYSHGLQISIVLRFIETDERDTLLVQFDKRNA